MNRRRLLTFIAVVVSVCATTASASAAIATEFSSLHAHYVGAQSVVAANGKTIALVGLQPPEGVIRFAVPRGATRLALRIEDASGKAIAVNVVSYHNAYATGDHIVCGATDITLRIPRRVNSVKVIPLAGECGSTAALTTSAPTTGDITATFKG